MCEWIFWYNSDNHWLLECCKCVYCIRVVHIPLKIINDKLYCSVKCHWIGRMNNMKVELSLKPTMFIYSPTHKTAQISKFEYNFDSCIMCLELLCLDFKWMWKKKYLVLFNNCPWCVHFFWKKRVRNFCGTRILIEFLKMDIWVVSLGVKWHERFLPVQWDFTI